MCNIVALAAAAPGPALRRRSPWRAISMRCRPAGRASRTCPQTATFANGRCPRSGGITGHYLNHSKEHCLVAVKGTLSEQFNRWDRHALPRSKNPSPCIAVQLESMQSPAAHTSGAPRFQPAALRTRHPLQLRVNLQPPPKRYMDCDVVMSMARETSRKPDEMYLMLERLCPGEGPSGRAGPERGN